MTVLPGLQPKEYLNKLPASFEPDDRILVVDPMLATGGTMTAVLHDIISRGGSTEYIRVLSIIAAAPALKLLSEEFKGAPLLTNNQFASPTVSLLLSPGNILEYECVKVVNKPFTAHF